jgi:hypothetical protein
MEPKDAGAALERALGAGFRGDLTIADAAAKSGLALRDAEAGLFQLVSNYRGHLRATEKGELVYRFPDGFTKPWETKGKLTAFGQKVGKGVVGVARFVVRAWISIVLIGYVGLFLAIIIGTMFAGGDRDRRGSAGFSYAPFFFRILFDALFWTFHPFSPFSYAAQDWGYQRRFGSARREEKKKEPFYERVNRYFFGPTPPPVDPRATERALVNEIRAQKGRIGLADVLRVTGLSRDEADPLLARLMLDYDGTVDVGDAGGLVYRFEALRLTVQDTGAPRPSAVWDKKEVLPPLTGNDGGSNVLISALNAFNIVMALVAFEQNWTVSRLALAAKGIPLWRLPFDGTPIALGVVPLVFSIALFALPIGRALFRRFKAAKIARENGRRALLRTIVTGVASDRELTPGLLRASYEAGAGAPPTDEELQKEVVLLGGDLEIEEESGKTHYRFADLEAEAKDVEAEREAAAEEEAKPGEVVFSSDA